MDEKVVPKSDLFASEDYKVDSLCPMYFGVSCALFALRLLSIPDVKHERWSSVRQKLLQGSAQLLGLLLWKSLREETDGKKSELVVKLESTEKEVMELKKTRREDAKANEKVVGIFAAREHSWLSERKMLRQQIGALMNELRIIEQKKDEAISVLNEKLKDVELLVQSKDKALEEEEKKRKEIEEKLIEATSVAEELRETVKRESQEHSSELWKHKTAFIKLVSNQRQLEADFGRSIRQVEAKKRELDSVLEQKEESDFMVQNLSGEIVKMHKDLEQKDKILSTMLRKSKSDIAEKQMLLKEVKLSKAKKKQAELERERWKAVTEPRNTRHSLRSMFAKQTNSGIDVISDESGAHCATASSYTRVGKNKSKPSDVLLRYDHFHEECTTDVLHVDEELTDVKQLERVCSETERYTSLLEQRHDREIDAFVEQLRLKDEKLEVLQWRFHSIELESKKLQTLVEVLNKDMTQLRHNNMKMDSLLLERDEELTSLKEQFSTQLRSLNFQNNNMKSSLNEDHIIERQPEEEEQETKIIFMEISRNENNNEKDGVVSQNQAKDVILMVQSPDKKIDEQNASLHCLTEEGSTSLPEEDDTDKLESLLPVKEKKPLNKTYSNPSKMNLHALGVSYKIKRLKQQLSLLEKLSAKKESCENNCLEGRKKELTSFMTLLNKQVGRYQSLQAKIDDLYKRMLENDLELNRRDSKIARTKDKTRTLEHFLEETFQLQRYMVATGQKLMEIKSKILSGVVGVAEELDIYASFDENRFADSSQTLLQEVQKGLEVRISRIIGDLEGTLACDGMIQLRR